MLKKIFWAFVFLLAAWLIAKHYVTHDNLEWFFLKHPQASWAARGEYLLGYYHQSRGEFDRADACYKLVLENKGFQKADAACDSLFRMGEMREDARQFTAAKEMYIKVMEKYPGTEKAKVCEGKMTYLRDMK